MMQRRQLVQLAVLLSVLGYFLWSAYAQWYDSPVQKARRARAAGVAGDSAESRPPQAAGAESAPASGPRPPSLAVAPPVPGAGESEE
ncbi:MAG: hypothetical protein HZA54_12810 [Planctomycetes bacterium]|nr:hypothetical protein [Planctomycetota bacterium]